MTALSGLVADARSSVALAFSFNGVGVPLAITGWVHPAWAMAAMVASVSTVLLNSFGLGLLLRRRKADVKAGQDVRVLELQVPALHCDGCLEKIRTQVERLDGIVRVDGDTPGQQLRVTYRPEASTPEMIRKKLVDAGFPAG